MQDMVREPQARPKKVENKVANISPEPGGVGPITVAMTLKNLLKCYRLQN